MNIQIFGTKKCNDTKKAQRYFKERGIKFQFIDMKEKGMSKGEFNSVAQANGGLENMIDWDGKDKDTLALIKYIAEEDKLAFEVENELMLIKGRAGDPGEYYSRIRHLAKRREDMQKKHKAYYIALGAIRGAADNLRAEISPRLSEYATALMQLMTGNKYNNFEVSDALEVFFTDSHGEKKSVEYLSGGTHDLAYVAVRAALIDMLYPEKPPICFDETFAHQDNVRARDMMRALGALSGEGCQSFVFTCRGREAALAGETVKGAGVFKLSVVEEERV